MARLFDLILTQLDVRSMLSFKHITDPVDGQDIARILGIFLDLIPEM